MYFGLNLSVKTYQGLIQLLGGVSRIRGGSLLFFFLPLQFYVKMYNSEEKRGSMEARRLKKKLGTKKRQLKKHLMNI